MAKEQDLKPFQGAERQKPRSASAPGAGQGAKAEDIGWRNFPQFEKILETESFQPVLQKIEKTCKDLDKIVQTGSSQEKLRAQAAMTAYGRTLDLLRQLTEYKDKLSKQQQ